MAWYNYENSMKGHFTPHTQESKQKMSLALKGKKYPNRKSPIPFTEAHKAKIGAYWKGRSRSISTKLKMSKAQKGKIRTLEAKEKNRKAHLGNHHTEEAKKKIGLAQQGEKNRFWKGGKMKDYPKSVQIRKSIEYKLWRDACFARDGYRCQKTGIVGDVIVHHIHNFADYPELRLAIDNGITLSVEAHKAFHKKYGKSFTTRKQLDEFLNLESI